MSRTHKGILGNFQGIGKVITAIALALGIGAIVLSGFQGQAYDPVLISDEKHTPAEDDGITDVDNVTVTVKDLAQGVVENSETFTFYDKSAAKNTTLTEDTNYTVTSYDDGKFDVVSVPKYNQSDGDALYVDYKHQESNKATAILGDGMTLLKDTIDWMGVAVIMLFGIIFMRYME